MLKARPRKQNERPWRAAPVRYDLSPGDNTRNVALSRSAIHWNTNRQMELDIVEEPMLCMESHMVLGYLRLAHTGELLKQQNGAKYKM